MAFLGFLGDAFSKVAGVITEPIKINSERKKEVALLDKEIEKINANAKLEAAKQGAVTTADWDKTALDNSGRSWKDEFLMLVLYSPVIGLFLTSMFFPDGVPSVIGAVVALNEFPLWYQILLWGILAHVFGLRWLVEPLVKLSQSKTQLQSKKTNE